ncbi:hypothetical protein BHE74_00051217 [Ensete ventricosum]|nr:hypothetical protein GW17_00052943 [Ensete ventricosum]RWW43151.1 hypothetical protein BHE74_00051217 [Ensete ventricosum]RZS22527.1 hypothetical protein BHM03_00055315 [Ensete ventricosum]
MEPWLLVWEAFTEQLEERQSDWAYLRPVVFLETLLNLAFLEALVPQAMWWNPWITMLIRVRMRRGRR